MTGSAAFFFSGNDLQIYNLPGNKERQGVNPADGEVRDYLGYLNLGDGQPQVMVLARKRGLGPSGRASKGGLSIYDCLKPGMHSFQLSYTLSVSLASAAEV
jgi:hypothetical protein